MRTKITAGTVMQQWKPRSLLGKLYNKGNQGHCLNSVTTTRTKVIVGTHLATMGTEVIVGAVTPMGTEIIVGSQQ
jgi:hypothetical protein